MRLNDRHGDVFQLINLQDTCHLRQQTMQQPEIAAGDTNNGRKAFVVKSFDGQADIRRTPPVPKQSNGLAIDSSGNLWVLDQNAVNVIHKFDSKGNSLAVYGGTGAGSGTFNNPMCIAISTK